MNSLLISWVGQTDLRAPEEEQLVGKGPITQALSTRSYDAAVLISDYPEKEVVPFLKWLRPQTKAQVTVSHEPLSGPTQFGEIYEAATRVVTESLVRHGKNPELTFHLSPGTPAMAAVWIILAKTRFPAELIESSPKHGVRTASVPFDISAEFHTGSPPRVRMNALRSWPPDFLPRPPSSLTSFTAAEPWPA